MTASQEITNYIKGLSEPAQSICMKLREIILNAVPGIKEDWKWGPNFNYEGMVCGLGGFKKHADLVFFNGVEMKDTKKIFNHGLDNDFTRGIKFADVSQINEKDIAAYVKESAAINKAGFKRTKKEKDTTTPDDLHSALRKNPVAVKFYDSLANGYKYEFIELVESAKKQETRDARIKKVVDLCSKGVKLNDKYKK